MNYKQIHDSIISQAQERATSKKEANLVLGYSEAHHILPKCMGGTNDKANIVHLSAREHFVIHQLLVKIYPLEPKLLYACHILLNKSEKGKINSRKYDYLKRKINRYQRSQNKQNNKALAERSAKQIGVPRPDVSVALSGRTKETHEYLQVIGQYRKGRTKDNDEFIRKIAESNRILSIENENTAVYLNDIEKISMIDIHKYFISIGINVQYSSLSKIIRRRRKEIDINSNKSTRRTKETCPGVVSQIDKLSKIPRHIQLEVYEKRESGISGMDIYKWLVEDLRYDVSYGRVSFIYNKIKKEKLLIHK